MWHCSVLPYWRLRDIYRKFCDCILSILSSAITSWTWPMLSTSRFKHKENNIGNRAFVDLLGDVNGTIIDKGLQNAYSIFYTVSWEIYYPPVKSH